MMRPCQVCRHLDRARIEILLAGGASFRSLSRQYKLHDKSISNHWHQHVDEERKAALLLGPVQKMNLAAQVAEESSSVLDHLKVIRAGLYSLFAASVSAGDRTGGALLAGRLTRVNEAIGRVTGQLANSPLIQLNQTNVAFTHDPGYARLQAQLIRVLSRFPDARAAVIAEFQKLEPGTGAGPVTIEQPPALPAPEEADNNDD